MLGQDESLLTDEQGRIVAAQPVSLEPGGKGGVDIFRIKYLSDGLQVVGFLLRPAGIEAGMRLPAVVFNRGGVGDSHKIDADTLAYLTLLPAAGYVVAATQYRGNDGSEGTESYLDKDVEDVRHILRLAKSLDCVDPRRVGILGFSRGAAVTYQLLREQVEIKAAVVMGCATDFVDAYDKLPHYRPFLEAVFGGTPETAAEAYTRRSPAYWPEKINVPLLIIQGTDDHHVPLPQVKAFAARLAELGKVHELVVYPEGDHTLDRVGEDKDRRILHWLHTHI